MPIELKVPTVGESVSEVEIGEWKKKTGEKVEKDETVVILESEKATFELPSPVKGTLGEILKTKGTTAAIGEVIGYVDETAVDQVAQPKVSTAKALPEKQSKPPSEAKARLMPAAERALAEQGLRPEEVTATGPGGRLLKEDVLRQAEQNRKGEAAPPLGNNRTSDPAREEQPAKEAAATPASAPVESKRAQPPGKRPVHGQREEEIVPMSRLRRTVAERLVSANQTAALLTTFNEIDMAAIIGLRKTYGEEFQAKHHAKLGFMSFFVKATVDALQLFPQVNAEIRGTDIVYHHYYDIGVAIGSGKGLVVPILRDADRMSFAEIEIAIHDFSKRAQDGKIQLDELHGGTFTITNGGVYGSLLSTPIVNPPQSGILGMHAIQERPVARDANVVIRPMMFVALTYDHRIVDGREAVTFLKRIKDVIENPTRILLEV